MAVSELAVRAAVNFKPQVEREKARKERIIKTSILSDL
jgi:hypothetical protein